MITVVKIGGSVVEAPDQLRAFAANVAAFAGNLVLVHGGGVLVTSLANRLGVPTTMVDGRRVTDDATRDLAVMVYAGLANKQLVASLHAAGRPCIGLAGPDANVIRATKRQHTSIDFGWVGDVDSVDTKVLQGLLTLGFTPVLCAITHDGSGQLLNTNADTIAAQVAIALQEIGMEARLLYLFDKLGVLSAENQVIPLLSGASIQSLAGQGVIHSGMLPKLSNALQAAAAGVTVRIGSVQVVGAILEEWQGGTEVCA